MNKTEVLSDEEKADLATDYFADDWAVRKAIKLLNAAEQAVLSKFAKLDEKQEPVGFLDPDDSNAANAFRWRRMRSWTTPLYTRPPVTPALVEAAEKALEAWKTCEPPPSIAFIGAMHTLRAAIEAHKKGGAA